MRYLAPEDLAGLLSPTALVAAVEEGLADFAAHRVSVPQRGHLDFSGNTLLTMPVAGPEVFGAKLVVVVPANGARGLPVVRGLMTLSDSVTGESLAILDAAALTAQRTGAVGAVGLKYTTPADIDRIGLIGVGVQGTWQAIFACAVRPVRTIHFVARSDEAAQRFTTTVSRYVPVARLIRCRDVNELLGASPVVICSTTSSTPVLPEHADLLRDKHFIGIGSFKPSMQEMPAPVYELAREVVVDSEAARTESGDLARPLAQGAIQERDLIHLADLVVGTRAVDTRRTTAFKCVGMALYDLYVARALYKEALRVRCGTELAT